MKMNITHFDYQKTTPKFTDLPLKSIINRRSSFKKEAFLYL